MVLCVYFTSLHCAALFYTAQISNALCYTALFCAVLYNPEFFEFHHTEVCSIVCTDTLTRFHSQFLPLHYTALHCTALQHTALHCILLICTAVYCTELHCSVLHCTSLYCTTVEYKAPILWSVSPQCLKRKSRKGVSLSHAKSDLPTCCYHNLQEHSIRQSA